MVSAVSPDISFLNFNNVRVMIRFFKPLEHFLSNVIFAVVE
jgi:hypothetical protein